VSRLAHLGAVQHWTWGVVGVGPESEGGPLGMTGTDGAPVAVELVGVGPGWGALVGGLVVMFAGVGPT
jgi:hypothetical protein